MTFKRKLFVLTKIVSSTVGKPFRTFMYNTKVHFDVLIVRKIELPNLASAENVG